MNKNELIQAIQSLPPFETIPELHTWPRHCYELRQHILTGDLDSFLQWSTIHGTMFRAYDEMMVKEVHELSHKGYTLPKESDFGNPPRLPDHPETSGNLVHQLYHLMQSGIDVSSLDSIVEFGGGYGAMAVVMWQQGFRGRYEIFDLPEWSLLQRYYLSHLVPEMNISYVSGGELIPERIDLFLALYSVSEISLEGRQVVLDALPPSTFFLAHQDVYQGVDNNKWFDNYTQQRSDYHWRTWLHPYMPGHRYVKGVKK